LVELLQTRIGLTALCELSGINYFVLDEKFPIRKR